MDHVYLKLLPSERVVTAAAAQIFAAYITSGLVREGNEEEWIGRSVREAIRIAQLTDQSVTSDDEMG